MCLKSEAVRFNVLFVLDLTNILVLISCLRQSLTALSSLLIVSNIGEGNPSVEII